MGDLSLIYLIPYKITIEEIIKTKPINNLEIQSIKIKISIIIELILETRNIILSTYVYLCRLMFDVPLLL